MATDPQIDVSEVKTAVSTEDADRLRKKEELRQHLAQAQQRFRLCDEAEARARRDALDDLKFSIGEQWPADIEAQRVADGRPCLTMDQLNQSIKQVCNEQRQQRPSVQINPVGDGATREVAEALQGMVRHIEVNSEAEIAYDTAFEHMVRFGFGYWRVSTEYLPGDTFDQELKIDLIKNPFTVYCDPAAMLPDQSDARFKFIIEDVPRSEYKLLYGDSTALGLPDYSSIGDNAATWATKETIRVAEYFYIEESTRDIVRLEDGTVKDEEDLEQDDVVVDHREVVDRKVIWEKINGVEVLDQRELPGKYIPVVPVLGTDLDIDGKRYLAGLTRNAKDPQRMYNYWNSAATETIALAPKAPFVGVKGQFKSSETQWKQMNQRNFPYIEYDPVSINGTPAGAPERVQTEPPIQAMSLMIRQAGNDIKASLGIYDASLGQAGPDQSGRAILARQKQGDLATLNFSDNLARSIRHTGRILVNWIPYVYDTPRIQRIVNPDQSVKYVGVFNSQQEYSPEEAQILLAKQKPAVTELHDVGVGTYDVVVSQGPNYQSKRQEAVASIMSLVQAYPQLMQMAGDLLVANMDWPYAQEISKRLKRTLPPEVLDQNDQSPEAQLTAAHAKLQQLGQQHDQLVQALQQANLTIQTKQVETKGRADIEKMKIDAQVAIAEINTKAQNASERAQMFHDIWVELHSAAHEQAMQATAPPPTNGAAQPGGAQ
jgi:hypothetical protein